MDITISNFTKFKAGGVLYCGPLCNGGSLGPLESDITVMLSDSLLKRESKNVYEGLHMTYI